MKNHVSFRCQGIEIAKLKHRLMLKDEVIDLPFPPWHAKFELPVNHTEAKIASVFSDLLILQLINNKTPLKHNCKKCLHSNEIWELWEDDQDNFHLLNPKQDLHRQIIIDHNFGTGEILGDFNMDHNGKNYPLPQDLEMVFFTNWLGGFGDVILHASGVAFEDKGYVFAGRSGVGKSTLAASLSEKPGITVLGEDQVILRLINGKFWVFGTPWHFNRNLCSPQGVRLEKVFFLEQRGMYVLEDISPMDCVTRLLQSAFIPYYRPDIVKRQLDRLARLSEFIPCFVLSYQLGTNILPRLLKGNKRAVL